MPTPEPKTPQKPRRFVLRAPRAMEHQEQASLMQWAAIEARRDPRLALLHASQNGLRTTPAMARRAKSCGMKAGVPDLDLPVACGGYHGLRIELKRQGGTPCDVRPEQSWWLEQLNAQGYRAVVAYGWEHAAEIITTYLESP